jgi:RND family efflux transporter MFP subunit
VDALYKRQVISKKEMDLADMEYNVAEAQLAASQQHLKLVREGVRQEVKEASRAKVKEMEALLGQERIHFENTLIAAPFRGEICKRYVDAGALISSSTPVVCLIHTDTLKVVANVLEKDVSLVKIGMKARIEAQSLPGKLFEGKITRINSALDSATRTLQAEIEIPNSDRVLKPGMFVRLEVVLSQKPQALVVPRNAVLEERGNKFLFVVLENQALRRSVTTGFEQDPDVEILEGVAEGERVVVKGQDSLKDRSAVRTLGAGEGG